MRYDKDILDHTIALRDAILAKITAEPIKADRGGIACHSYNFDALNIGRIRATPEISPYSVQYYPVCLSDNDRHYRALQVNGRAVEGLPHCLTVHWFVDAARRDSDTFKSPVFVIRWDDDNNVRLDHYREEGNWESVLAKLLNFPPLLNFPQRWGYRL